MIIMIWYNKNMCFFVLNETRGGRNLRIIRRIRSRTRCIILVGAKSVIFRDKCDGY